MSKSVHNDIHHEWGPGKRVRSRHETTMRHVYSTLVSLKPHLLRMHYIADVALAPQVDFELLTGHAATKHRLDKTSGSLYYVQRDCAILNL